MAWLRILGTGLALFLGWASLVWLAGYLTDTFVPWMGLVALLLAALQWVLAPTLLRALYRIQWLPQGEYGAPSWLRIGVIETEDPWCMAFRGSLLLTQGLQKLLADEPAALAAVLEREFRLAGQPDIGAASALAAPIIWAGVTEEFCLGGGRAEAAQRGLGGGFYVGLMARLVYRIASPVAAVLLRGRQAAADTPAFAPVLRRLAVALQAATPTYELSLRRAYAARSAILLPVDVGELARLALLDADLDHAAAQALSNPWERWAVRFHPPLGHRLGLAPSAADPRYLASYASARRQQLLPWLLAAAGGADVAWRHLDVGAPFLGLGLGVLLALRLRYPPRLPMRLLTIERPDVAAVPWYSQPLTRVPSGQVLPLLWAPTIGLTAGLSPLTAVRHGEVNGWERYETVPYLEVLHARDGRQLRVNHAVLLRTLLGVSLVLLGLLLNLISVAF